MGEGDIPSMELEQPRPGKADSMTYRAQVIAELIVNVPEDIARYEKSCQFPHHQSASRATRNILATT